MKKIFTLCAAMITAMSLFAETPLKIGGGWNNGFIGDAESFTFSVAQQWGAAEYAFNVNSNEYTKAIIEFETECPANFQVNYNWKATADAAEATPAYGVADPTGKTTVEVTFNAEHPIITGLAVQHTVAETESPAILKIKKLTLVSANDEKKVTPSFTGWAGSDLTEYYAGTVSFKGQYMQLQVSGLTGSTGQKFIKVVLAEPFTSGFQLCIDYEGDTHDYPQFEAGKAEVIVSTKADAISNFGIQAVVADEMKVTVVGVYDVTEEQQASLSNLDAEKGDVIMYNILGQRVTNAKGLVIINGKKVIRK